MIYFKMTDSHPSSRTMDAYVGPCDGILIRRVKDTTSDKVESFTVRIHDTPLAFESRASWGKRNDRQIEWMRSLSNKSDLRFLDRTKNQGVLWFHNEFDFLSRVEEKGMKI